MSRIQVEFKLRGSSGIRSRIGVPYRDLGYQIHTLLITDAGANLAATHCLRTLPTSWTRRETARIGLLPLVLGTRPTINTNASGYLSLYSTWLCALTLSPPRCRYNARHGVHNNCCTIHWNIFTLSIIFEVSNVNLYFLFTFFIITIVVNNLFHNEFSFFR